MNLPRRVVAPAALPPRARRFALRLANVLRAGEHVWRTGVEGLTVGARMLRCRPEFPAHLVPSVGVTVARAYRPGASVCDRQQ